MARVMTAIRIPPDALREIDRRAEQRGLTRTDYMIQAAIGDLDVDEPIVEQRLGRLEERIDRLERFAFDGG